jgi:hypothetical protein
MENQIEIYRGADGQTQIEVRFEEETVWLSQKQMSELFEKDTDTIGLHLKNIYSDEELDVAATTEDYSVVQQEGKRKVKRTIKYYNLDAVISVGYRVNSKRGVQFRQWATQRLREYLIQGYALNERRLAQKDQHIQTLKNGISILSRAIETKTGEVNDSWLEHFAKGLELLDDYDHEKLDQNGINLRPATFPALSDYLKVIEVMRGDFESSVFGKEKDDSFHSSVAQISKGFGDVDFYPSIEEKAATLLYLIIKNQ